MMAVDMVVAKAAKTPLPLSAKAGATLFKGSIDRGVVVRPIGDRLVLSPPIIISKAQTDQIVDALHDAIAEFAEGLALKSR